MLQCKKCGSLNVTVTPTTYVQSKSRSFLWNLIMVLITGGLWLLWMLIRKKKEKVVTKKICCCHYCGNTWEI